MPLHNANEFPRHDFTPDELKLFFYECLPTTEVKETQKRPWASQAGFCERLVALNGLLPQREVDRSSALNFYGSIGKSVEIQAIKDYDNAGRLIVADYYLPNKLFDGFNIGGKIDCIVEKDDKPILIDVKTVAQVEQTHRLKLTPADFASLQKSGTLVIGKNDERIKKTQGKAMYASYYAQLQIYAAITGINNVYLQVFSRNVVDNFVWGKDNPPTTTFYPVPVDDGILTKRIGIMMYGLLCRDNDVVPKKNRDLVRAHCNNAFCEFEELCWGEQYHPLVDIDDKLEKELKHQAFTRAKKYIAERGGRYQEFLKILERDTANFDINYYLKNTWY